MKDNQHLVLDVKLSICSSPITIYKYLPIFENTLAPRQLTFFPEWISEDTLEEVPGLRSDEDGQLNLFSINNILYICYLIGKPQKNYLPGSEIACGPVSFQKKKKIPHNMEIRFLEFHNLPELYCRVAGIEYDEALVAHFLDTAERIKQVVLSSPENAGEISREIYQAVKHGF
ncbi:hypothetical protein KAT92_00560 [Candidatus Babeliales bacterium]|nr:hypothetical protein [Candidatus Babeliales bacterium]